MYCYSCGAKLGKKARYCPNCGAPLSKEQNAPNWSQISAVLVAVILVFSAAIGAILFLHARRQSPSAQFLSSVDRILAEAPGGLTSGSELDAAILSRMSYQVLELKDDHLLIAVTAPDMRSVLEDGALFAEPDGIEKAIFVLKSGTYGTLNSTVDVQLDSSGAPIDPYALYDAMYGGMLSLISDVLE